MPSATPDQLVRQFCAGFSARNATALKALFGPHALFEFPFLQPRLVGQSEIWAGLERAFEIADGIAIELQVVKENGGHAIAEGRMEAHVARDDLSIAVPFALVAEARDGKLGRLSIYCDAHPYRLWSDGPVMAFDTEVR
ncbi:MAG: nuclear transport factor 2 family protein [Rhodospirillaceae bacterium]|nr:nuclear transport factor 2 family protein [Rhodospirillaceae bacterium]